MGKQESKVRKVANPLYDLLSDELESESDGGGPEPSLTGAEVGQQSVQ